jgi:hypothetical protein
MSGIKWALCALIILASLFVRPGTAQSVDVDPYLYKSLYVGLYFQYDRDTDGDVDSDYETLTTSFEQMYTFDILSNIVSRWLMTYDTGLHFARRTTGSPNSKATTHSWYTYFSTTILPKTNIPLTLYLNNTRYSRVSNNGSTKSKRNKFTYGLNWHGRFRVLPIIRIKLKTSHQKSESTHTVDSDYNLNLKKKFGATDNAWDTQYSVSEDRLGEDQSTQLSTNFTNRTEISRNTRLNVAAAASKTDSGTGLQSTIVGMNTSLSSSSSKSFSHNHSYSFISLATEGESDELNENHSYSGNMKYRITDDLTSSASVNTNISRNSSPTSTHESDSLAASGNLSYRITDRLHFTETVSYLKNVTNTEESDNTTLDNRIEFKATSGLSYSNNYSWTSLSTSGSLGYSATESELYGDGTGLVVSTSTSLSRINFVPTVSLNTSASYSTTRISTSEEIGSALSYSFSGSNTVLLQYAKVKGSYNYTTTKNTTSINDKTKTVTKLNAGSEYFETFPFSYTLHYSTSKDFFVGTSTSLQKAFTTRHRRILFRGELIGSFRHSTNDNTYEGGSQHSTTKLFTATYQRGITWSSLWNLALNWQHDTVDGKVSEQWSIINGIQYQMRSWLLTTEHTYKRRIQYNRDMFETRFMLSASRSFGFSWQ